METGSNPFFWVDNSTQGYVTSLEHYKLNDIYVEKWHLINAKDIWRPNGPARSYHAKGINATMCDARVAFVSETIDFDIYRGLFEKSGDNLATLP